MTPLLWATLAFCAGLLAGFRLSLAPPLVAVLACGPLLLLVLRGRAVLPLALVGAGVVAGTLRSGAAAADCREHLADGERVRIVAVARALPVPGLTAAMHGVSLQAATRTCSGVAVRVRAAPADQPRLMAAAQGDAAAVALHGKWLRHPPRNGWPRAPQYAGMLLVDSVNAATADAGAMAGLRIAQQARMRTLLPERWALAEAMLLAQKSGLAPETRSRWVAAGLVHLLAISGMHVGMIAAGVIALARLASLSRRRARRVALLVTAAYVLFLGAPSAALRALLQFALLLGALELQRPAEPFTALAAAALCILLIEPLALLDPGFQLSFAGMIGLIAWRRPLAALIPARVPRFLRDGIAAGIAASALTTPVAALHFGTASWIGVPASIVAVPVLAAAVALVVAALLVAALTGLDSGLHAWPADFTLRVLDAVAAAAAAVPGGHGHLGTPTVLYGLLACAAAVLFRARLRGADDRSPRTSAGTTHGAQRGRMQVLRGVTAGALAVAVLSWAPLLLRSHAGLLEIHVIDVGQGEAIAIRSPAGRWLLVDTGPRTARFDAGRDRVVPYLLRRGARRIDALLLTHPDADHIGGAEAVLEVFDVGLVIDPGFAAGKDMFIDLLVAARRADRRWVAARAGHSFVVDGVEITLLYPLPQLDGAPAANDNSVVFRLGFGAFGALFTGDAPTAVEDEIVARHGTSLRAAVLKVGHHGSRTSTGERLLDAAQPSIALISAGRNNRYGHPNPGVLRRLDGHGIHVVRTDERGSFVVRARRDGRAEVLAR